MQWKIKLMLSVMFLIYSIGARTNELVIGTTFASQGIQHLITEWNKQPNALPVITLNRTSYSLTQLFATERANEVDLILSSSPMLFYNLQQKQKLSEFPPHFSTNPHFVPPLLNKTTIAFSLSGYGLLLNPARLTAHPEPLPTQWQDLIQPELQGLVIISSPTRSDTNHIMLEALLQKYGWEQGWALIQQVAANIGTLSSRSFGVADKIQGNLGAIGITIDNYAHLLPKNAESPLIFRYFPDFPISPTFIAVTANSRKKVQAFAFIAFLLSPQGQQILTSDEMGKIPISPLEPHHPKYAQQQFLLAQPQINYDLLLQRQYLVKQLFEHQITYRLSQLQENWMLLHQKEKQLNRPLTELRQILTALPVSEKQSFDPHYFTETNHEHRLLNWQQFFIEQQDKFIHLLEQLP